MNHKLRVLVIDSALPANDAFVAWLQEQGGLDINGPFTSVAAAIGTATKYHPHVVLLDFHGMPVSVGYTATLFKELRPAPAVLVLTHDASATMRRRCQDARVDAVFDKTRELPALAQALTALAASRPAA